MRGKRYQLRYVRKLDENVDQILTYYADTIVGAATVTRRRVMLGWQIRHIARYDNSGLSESEFDTFALLVTRDTPNGTQE